jgi:hypothetical protein
MNQNLNEIDTFSADGFIGDAKKWLNYHGGQGREKLGGYMKEFQMRGNCRIRNEDVWETWLNDLALVEHRLRTTDLTIKKLKEYIKWDFSAYVADKKISDELYTCPLVSNGIDTYDERVTPGMKDIWFCRGCEYSCEGKGYMKERTAHKRKCKYYLNHPRSPVFDHMSSKCACCVFDKKGKKRKWWRAVQDEIEADKKKKKKVKRKK